jgi:hypothetical protein
MRVLSLACKSCFDRSWQLFTDVILRPSFTKDVSLVQDRAVVALSGDTDNPDTHKNFRRKLPMRATHT